MFQKKPAFAFATASSAGGVGVRDILIGLRSNPYVGAAGAALLFAVTLGVLVLALGDPTAGAPSVRVRLQSIGATKGAPPGWLEALAPEPKEEAPLIPDVFTLSESPGRHEADAPAAKAEAPYAPPLAAHGPLPAAPIAGLWAPGPGGGKLPVVAPGGRTPAEAYARPFTPDGRPRVALVIGGLGLNAQTTRAAIEQLPAEITLSFAPYGEDLQGWIDLARRHGHEVLLETPLEPNDYPQNDPGPYTLMSGARPEETVRKLEWLMSRASGYFGLTNYLGSRYLKSDMAVATLTAVLKQRGLAFIDDGQANGRGAGLRASADRIIDDQLSAEAINRQLKTIEGGAVQRGQALGSGFAYPVTIRQTAAWAQGLSARGFQLAPASAVTSKR
ncbi:divergent polysaccharide deacetylase family protein [Caulobacter segnis]|uniref:divergent polysaccharide deacetylase family protein n=1 Tax=Caulobacter segnis TaxID=88688 RepID=UPI00241067C2|nr:divergent polysaccharide deacetylase family protein [Caulobacter segnis]MDG2521679.1 divergent polysaccharide deacetylase family protein [Caulobacter segnis]